MVGDTCVPSLIVIDNAINQLETKVSLKNNVLPEAICCCLQICNIFVAEVMMGDTCTPCLVIGTTVNQF